MRSATPPPRRTWRRAALAALWLGAALGAHAPVSVPSNPDATVVVRVESIGTEQPLAGVPVWAGRKPVDGDRSFFFGPIDIEGTYRQMEGVSELARTAANGEAELRVPAGVELFVIAACSHGDMRRLEPLAKGERRTSNLPLWVGRMRYQGLVRERVSGAPVAGARVEGLDYDAHVRAEARTDDAGRFQLESPEALDAARIRAPGFGLTLGALVPGHANPERPLVTWLDRGARLRGRVLELDGRALAGAPVRCTVESYALLQPETISELFQGSSRRDELESWQATTDAEGRFELADLPARAWLRLELPDPRRPWSELHTFAPGEERELALVPGARVTLSGITRDADGKPAANLPLHARRFGLAACSPEEALARTDADGSFRFPDLMPGVWFLAPAADTDENEEELGFAPTGQRVELPSAPAAQELTLLLEARTGTAELERHAPPAAGSIAVGVKDDPSVRPRTLLLPHGRPDLARSEFFGIHIDASTFENLEAGLYDAILSTDDRRLGRVEDLAPTPEGTNASVELHACATLRFVFTGPELFARVIAHQGDAVTASTIATQGAACGLFVPPGKIRLEVFPLRSWDAVPSGPPLTRELTAVLDQEPEVLVP